MELYWIWLSLLKGIGPVTMRNLVNGLGTPERVYTATHEELQSIPGIHSRALATVFEQRSLDPAEKIREQMQRLNISLLTYNDPQYPARLNSFSELSALLYYRGEIRSGHPNVGIIGSRRCTAYGKQVTTEAAEFLAKSQVVVASGLAKGIDGYAHTACLQAKGYTLAFVANGVDICYPPEHQSLMDGIIENGAVISPYPPGTRPRQEYFPYRNKLLAAWVDKLFVVEAAEKSGALLTAQYAKEYQRELWAAPNSLYSPESVGTNRLLADGAKVYLTPGQLVATETGGVNATELKASGPTSRTLVPSVRLKKEICQAPAGSLETMLLNRLDQPQPISGLLDIFAGDLSALLDLICQLELEGKVLATGQMVRKVT